MSTMLKTAAMTLLSKTLQTFLYKYLSDVDVEGVALPSVYDGSGWGVRLSNVKLREGVQLMKELPGKRKKKKRRRKRPPKKKNDDNKSRVTEEQNRNTNGTTKSNNNYNHYHAVPNGTNPKQSLKEPTTSLPGGTDEGMDSSSLHVSELQRTTSRDYFESDNDDDDDRPGTPDQNSKSIFSCFQASRSGKANDDAPKSLPEISLHDDDKETTKTKHNGKFPPERVESELTFDAGGSFSNRETVDLVDRIDAALEDHDTPFDDDGISSFSRPPPSQKQQQGDINDDDDDDDEFEEYEQPLKLCLGENGRIGILDIRLIGKELHVLVEDAVLTIEAIPIAEEEDDENDTDDLGEQHATEEMSKASGQESAPAPQPTAKPKETKNKAESKRATVGDRVLADNPLARAIASIPHLFLRDIRIRLIIRNEAPPEKTEAAAQETEQGESSAQVNADENDCLLEIGIEFLSVTSGEDVLSHFQQQQDDESFDESEHSSVRPPMNSIHSFSSVENTMDQNEYLVRHIRTGRGPSAGLSVQIFSPGKPMTPWDGRTEMIWARQQWMLATGFYLLRCSGLDIRAKIPVGTKKEVGTYSWFYGDQNGDDEAEYDESTLDSLIFGVDHVAPGPHLPLPPISPHMSRGDTPLAKGQNPPRPAEQDRFATQNVGPESFYMDSNGIQSCSIPSSFHRVARGMLPAAANNCQHLPSQICPNCWDAPRGVKKTSELDESIPMPGLAFQVTMRDPLEINVDRSSLEVLGTLKSLFQKKQPPQDPSAETQSENDETEELEKNDAAQDGDEVTETTASTSYFGSILTRKKKETVNETTDSSDAFAVYMQPENIQIIGVHLSEIKLRLHVMSETDIDKGMSFCYWDVMTKCLTLDHQSLKSKEKTFQDLRFDVGNLTWTEYRGIESTEIMSLGLPYPDRRRADSNTSHVSVATIATIAESEEQSKIPWPSTAAVLMDIPPPLESIMYKTRERHGMQLRFVSVNNLREVDLPVQSSVHVRLGMMSMQAQWGFWRNFGAIRREIVKIITKDSPNKGGQEVDDRSKTGSASNDISNQPKNEDGDAETQSSNPTPPPVKSLMKYKVQLDGGNMSLEPVMHTKLPLTQFCGERSTDEGIFVESILQKLEFAYGNKTKMEACQLDVQRVAELPENVRMRILLCLDDLGPLEKAFQVKKESNSFKRCRAVNKGILKMAKKLRKAKQKYIRSHTSASSTTSTTRRQEIMSDFMKLNDKELDELWSLHQKHKRKLAKVKAKRDL